MQTFFLFLAITLLSLSCSKDHITVETVNPIDENETTTEPENLIYDIDVQIIQPTNKDTFHVGEPITLNGLLKMTGDDEFVEVVRFGEYDIWNGDELLYIIYSDNVMTKDSFLFETTFEWNIPQVLHLRLCGYRNEIRYVDGYGDVFTYNGSCDYLELYIIE